jgi:hypothetical protein
METMNQKLLQELFLLGRNVAVEKVSQVFDGQLKELCLRTRYPKELDSFVAACLAQRGELDKGAGERCLFVRNRETWQRLCETEPPHRIFVAHPELDFEAHKTELLQQARVREHSVIYAITNPRPDTAEVVDLRQPKKYEVQETLKKHQVPEDEANRLAQRSNGNVYLLVQLVSDTTERRKWAAQDVGYRLRWLALLGGWNDSSKKDKAVIGEIADEPYEGWVQILYPYTRQEEPPVLLEGNNFRPVSRYETWQQLGHNLSDKDLLRFKDVAIKILSETEPAFDLPPEKRQYAGLQRDLPETCTPALRRGIAETLALLSGQGQALTVSPNTAQSTSEAVVWSLLNGADWKRWASLSSDLPLLAEAAPEAFLSALKNTLQKPNESPLNDLFAANDGSFFGRNYHCGLLWALEVLAWYPDYLCSVSIILAQLASYPLPKNLGNNPLDCLRSIFLTWLPQTLGTIEQRRVAVEKVIEENAETGWQLLLELLPAAHQSGSYNQKPVWRDWLDGHWKEGVTRQEMTRQIQNYAELAVQCAFKDIIKLNELIARWDNLPPDVFEKVLEHLKSPVVRDLPEAERFILWQKLTDESSRHRRFAKADWAMPDEELKKLEAAAEAIKPVSPAILYQRLFNDYEHHFFTQDTSNYGEQRDALAAERSQAVLAIIKEGGVEAVIKIAKSVKLPVEIGMALGRVGNQEFDLFLLPKHLENNEKPILEMVKGYIWARYFTASFAWVQGFNLTTWSVTQKAKFFSAMPFEAQVWRAAEQALGDKKNEYWDSIRPNSFQAGKDLIEAISKAVENKRGDIAVNGINCLIHTKQQIPTPLATAAVRCMIENYPKNLFLDQYELVEIIKHLQSAPDADINDLSWIEFQSLKLLDHTNGASPVILERRMSAEPKFFHETMTLAFRSERDIGKPKELDEHQSKLASHVFGLLHHWQTPPGTTKSGTIDEENFKAWIVETKKLSEESGHWAIAQQLIGQALTHGPAGLVGLLNYPEAAKILDHKDFEEMRRGFSIALFNSRGVHGFSSGSQELEIAKGYRDHAQKYELAGFTRIAVTLRSIADSYQRDAEREAKRDPYGE